MPTMPRSEGPICACCMGWRKVPRKAALTQLVWVGNAIEPPIWRNKMHRKVVALGLISALAAPNAFAQSQEELDLMQKTLSDLNLQSFEEGVEFCGYVGFTVDGVLAISPPTRGDESSCLSDEPDNLELLTASYHTHGDFSTEYSSETPSGDDMEGDEEEGIDGWVSTPGGRLWYIDTTDMVTFQICGIGCLPKDPDFIEGDDGFIEEEYTYDELVERLE